MFFTDLIACSFLSSEAVNLALANEMIGNWSLCFIFVSAIVHGVLFYRQQIAAWHFLIAAACPFVYFICPKTCMYSEFAVTTGSAAVISLFMLIHACFSIFREKKHPKIDIGNSHQNGDLSNDPTLT